MAEMRFTARDGRTGTLRGPTEEAIRDKAASMGFSLAPPEPPAGTVAASVAAAAPERFLDNAAGVVNAPGRILNSVSSLARNTQSRVQESLPEFLRPAAGALMGPLGAMGSLPEFGQIPTPSGRELASAIESPIHAVMAGQSLPDTFRSRMDLRERVAEDQPGGAMVGSVLGDAATLMSGRAPLMRGRQGGVFDEMITGGVNALRTAVNPAGKPAGFQASMDRVLNSGAFRELAKGSGRAVESGLEGYALSALQDGDPMEVAAISAGSQAASSASNTLLDSVVGAPGNRNIKRAGAYALGGFVVLQFLKSALPGGDDNPVSTLETGFDKAMLGGLIGLGIGLAGRRGAPQGMIAKDFPVLADAMASIPRAGIIQIAQEATKDPEMERVMINAGQLGDSDLKRYREALESENPVDAVRDLMARSPRLRERLTAPDPRLVDVPVRSN